MRLHAGHLLTTNMIKNEKKHTNITDYTKRPDANWKSKP